MLLLQQRSRGREKELVPKKDWLEWKGRNGWGPLCEIVGKKRPGGSFLRPMKVQSFAVSIENMP